MKTTAAIYLILMSFQIQLFSQELTAQPSDLTPTKGITDPIHKANIGTIQFLSGSFPNTPFTSGEFIHSFIIEEDSNLNFIAFFNNSLTNYLHQLDPSLSIEELNNNGNFEFSFFIDGNLIYKERLHYNAGLPNEKMEQTLLYKPLISNRRLDSWSRFLWLRFLYRSDAHFILEQGNHLLKIEIRPYLQTDTLRIGDVIAEGELLVSLTDPDVPEELTEINEISSNSGWPVSTFSFNKQRVQKLKKRIAQERFKDITSIVVIKDGELLIEEYFNGASRSTLHNTRSVGKSFTSTITGIAIEQGYLEGVHQPLSDFYNLENFGNSSPSKNSVTIEHLLTMSSIFQGNDNDFDSPGNEEKMYPTSDWVKFTLDLPTEPNKKNGTRFRYFTAGVVLLGDILDKSVPGGLEKYAHENLFDPLGITEYQWQYTPKKVANTAGGLQLRSIDYAKYGQLYLNNGRWMGNQIISSDWVNKSHSNYFNDEPDETPYGYLFWEQSFELNGKEYVAYLCNGNGGNKIVMFKDLPIVIVITSTAYGQFFAHPQSHRIIQNYLLPAILE